MVCDTTGVSECVDSTLRQLVAVERLLVSQRSVEFVSPFLGCLRILFGLLVLYFSFWQTRAVSFSCLYMFFRRIDLV